MKENRNEKINASVKFGKRQKSKKEELMNNVN